MATIVYLMLTPPLRMSTVISQRLHQHLTATWWTQEASGVDTPTHAASLVTRSLIFIQSFSKHGGDSKMITWDTGEAVGRGTFPYSLGTAR